MPPDAELALSSPETCHQHKHGGTLVHLSLVPVDGGRAGSCGREACEEAGIHAITPLQLLYDEKQGRYSTILCTGIRFKRYQEKKSTTMRNARKRTPYQWETTAITITPPPPPPPPSPSLCVFFVTCSEAGVVNASKQRKPVAVVTHRRKIGDGGRGAGYPYMCS